MGTICRKLDADEDAEIWEARALRMPIRTAEAFYYRAFLRMARGEWRQVFQDHETRWAQPAYRAEYRKPFMFQLPKWDGMPTDRRVYLHWEQGFGDTIMLARYFPLVKEIAPNVLIEVQRELLTLMQQSFPSLDFTAPDNSPIVNWAKDDCHLPLFSLPYIFNTTRTNVPKAPYLRARPGVGSGALGFCWCGSKDHENDHNRSLTDEEAAEFVRFTPWDFDSLVPGPIESALSYPLRFRPATGHLLTFADTASSILSCHAVVTVDTAVAHLAGALGARTYLLVPKVAEWRWGRHGETTPWYPSMTLVRQTVAGDWSAPFQRVRALLEQELTQHG